MKEAHRQYKYMFSVTIYPLEPPPDMFSAVHIRHQRVKGRGAPADQAASGHRFV